MTVERYEGTGRMSRVVVHNGTMYLCGQTSGEKDQDIKAQTSAVLKKVEDLLDKYGSDKKHILSTTIYIKEMSLFSEMNEVWDSWVEKGFEPARACVEAKMAREEILVEMSVIAAVK
ncbi:RidA family protein [Clostridium hydrogeniformans]|uniref:RidA family protein n=1 Tax=Clostridium hydrogeniformans TaxID=349933 RepID=UPI00047F5CF7|nr:RidA family protein [Clostridium hydrogeniformans]